MDRYEQELSEHIEQQVWNTVWLTLDAEPGWGAYSAGAIAAATARAFREAFAKEMQVTLPPPASKD